MSYTIDNTFLTNLIIKATWDDVPDVKDWLAMATQQAQSWSAPTCEVCYQTLTDGYMALPTSDSSHAFFCSTHWEELKAALLVKPHQDESFLTSIKYEMLKATFKLAYKDHGQYLLDTMDYLRLWCDEHLETGRNVWFLGRDMDIFYHLMVKVYKYDTQRIRYLGGWDRLFMDGEYKPNHRLDESIRNIQKQNLLTKLGLVDGDAVIDSGFSGSIPGDIKKFRDVRALLLTKNNYANTDTHSLRWVEYYMESGGGSSNSRAEKYRHWVVKVEHDYKGKTVWHPVEPLSIPIEYWDEEDLISQTRWDARVLAYKLALRKAEKHALREERVRNRLWKYRTKAELEAISAAVCDDCKCHSCYNQELGMACCYNGPCKDDGLKLGCEQKKLDCGDYINLYSPEPKGKLVCENCLCNWCEARATCKTKEGYGCAFCAAHSYAGVGQCSEYNGTHTIKLCMNCVCSKCAGKGDYSVCSSGCFPSDHSPACQSWKDECPLHAVKECSNCQCNDCPKADTCQSVYCSQKPVTNCMSWVKHECSSKTQAIKNQKMAGAPHSCEFCMCENCSKAGSNCPCNKAKGFYVQTPCGDYTSKCSLYKIKTTLPVSSMPVSECTECQCHDCKHDGDQCYHCYGDMPCYAAKTDCIQHEPKYKEEPKEEPKYQYLKLDICKNCKCSACMALCPEPDTCLGCDNAIEHCQHHFYYEPYEVDSFDNTDFQDIDF